MDALPCGQHSGVKVRGTLSLQLSRSLRLLIRMRATAMGAALSNGTTRNLMHCLNHLTGPADIGPSENEVRRHACGSGQFADLEGTEVGLDGAGRQVGQRSIDPT